MSKTITLTDEQHAALQAGKAITIEPPKPKTVPWEPKGGEWYTLSNGNVKSAPSLPGFNQFGNTFETKEQAEAEAKAMRARNRLAAYVREFAPDWEADWIDYGQKKWFVCFNPSDSNWESSYIKWNKSACEVYMPEDVANTLIQKLNSGEVAL